MISVKMEIYEGEGQEGEKGKKRKSVPCSETVWAKAQSYETEWSLWRNRIFSAGEAGEEAGVGGEEGVGEGNAQGARCSGNQAAKLQGPSLP